jgi:hypothetical protein
MEVMEATIHDNNLLRLVIFLLSPASRIATFGCNLNASAFLQPFEIFKSEGVSGWVERARSTCERQRRCKIAILNMLNVGTTDMRIAECGANISTSPSKKNMRIVSFGVGWAVFFESFKRFSRSVHSSLSKGIPFERRVNISPFIAIQRKVNSPQFEVMGFDCCGSE